MDRLEAFLFILIRDHVPIGVVAEIIKKNLGKNKEFFLTNDESERLAKRFACEIKGKYL